MAVRRNHAADGALLASMLALGACGNKNPDTLQPALTLGKIASVEQHRSFAQEAQNLTAYIESGLKQAEISGKPPLILLMENHYDRNAMMRSLAVLLKMKQKGKDIQLLLEQAEPQYQEWVTTASNAHGVVTHMDALDQQFHTGKIREKPKFDIDGQDGRAFISQLTQSIPNITILGNIAQSNKIDVRFSPSPIDPAAHDFSVSTPENFYPRMMEVEQRLMQLLEKADVKPSVMVVGQFHGKAIADHALRYHVIPISLDDATKGVFTNIGNISIADVTDRLQRGEKLSQNEQFIAERCQYAAQAHQATHTRGIDTISAAVDVVVSKFQASDKKIDVSHMWLELDKPTNLQRIR